MRRLNPKLLYVVYAVIVVFLAAAVINAFHKDENKTKPQPAAPSNHQPSSPQPSKSQAGNTQTGTDHSQTTGGTAKSQTASAGNPPSSGGSLKTGPTKAQGHVQAPGPSSTGSHQLNNTGPGDSIGIFVAVSLLGALLHRRFLTNN